MQWHDTVENVHFLGTHLNQSPRRLIIPCSLQHGDNSLKQGKKGLFYKVFKWLSYGREGYLGKYKLIILDQTNISYFHSS